MLGNVNSTDLYSAIELGCRNMSNMFNKDDGDIPFFNVTVWPEAFFGQGEHHNESHVPGRHLNALLMAEACAGVEVGEEVIRKHSAAAYFSFSSHIPMPLNRLKENGKLAGAPRHFLDHNIREGMHALYALSRFRGDAKADELMRQAIGFIGLHYIPGMAWDDTVTADPSIVLFESPFIVGVARAIGPLVKYHRFCGYAPALELAQRLAEKAKEHYPVTGEYSEEIMGTTHAHSVGCVMSSLAQLADTVGDRELMERVRSFYDNGMFQIRNELGWAVEIAGKEIPKGECNTSGDILETALILGKHFDAAYYDDAERILRGYLLPAQIRDTGFIKNPENPENKDALRNVAERLLGAFGFAAPYGHQPKDIAKIDFNTDVVGGTVASLCEAYAACTEYADGVHHINLLFDRETDAVSVTSLYSDKGLTVTVRKPGPLYVRIPSWAEREQLKFSAAGTVEGDWILFAEPKVGESIGIELPLTERKILLHTGVHTLRARMKGDTVLAMDNEGTDFTFFPEYTE